MAKYRLCSGFAMAPEKDMKMLAKMSKKGWHFAGMKGIFLYRFEQGEPHNYQYALNMESEVTGEMLSIYEAGGWKAIMAESGAQIFRAEEGTAPIFSDTSSEIEMLEKNRKRCAIGVAVFAILFAVNMFFESLNKSLIFDIFMVWFMVAFVFTFFPFIGFSLLIRKRK